MGSRLQVSAATGVSSAAGAPLRFPVEGPGPRGLPTAPRHTALRNILVAPPRAQLAAKIPLIFSAVGQLFAPAEAAAIPTILPRSALITANSMALLTMVLTLVVGGSLAPILSRIDLYAPYWFAVVLLVVAGTLIFASEIPALP